MKQTIEVEAHDWSWSEWLKTNRMIKDEVKDWRQSEQLKKKQMIEYEANDWTASESVNGSYDEGWSSLV